MLKHLITTITSNTYIGYGLCTIGITVLLLATLCSMQAAVGGGGGGRVHRAPPAWDPANANTYSFREWSQDLQTWSIAHPDIAPAQQTANVILQLGGAARNLVRNMSYQDMTVGGMLDGVQVDPMTFLISHLAAHFAPLGEESRLTAMTELMQFQRNPGEAIDALLTRFMGVQHRAQQGANVVPNIEMNTWLLLRACGVNATQLLQLLQPFQNRYPNTAAEFHNLQLTLRRMGHIIEGSPQNLASQLRSPPNGQGAGTFMAQTAPAAEDPWHSAGQPDPWGYGNPAATPAPAFPTMPADDSSDDTATVSTEGEPDYSEVAHLPPAQVDEQLFWAYERSKRNWRTHMRKPTRRVRKFVKHNPRTKGKGRGSGKGKGRFSFLAEMTDRDVEDIFYGGKGKNKGKNGKGKRRSSGKGFGRTTNPRGRDGTVMTCSICGSEAHFRAQCPSAQNSPATAGLAVDQASASYQVGPLSGITTGYLAFPTMEEIQQVADLPVPTTPPRPLSLERDMDIDE